VSYLAYRLHLLNRLLARPASDRRYIRVITNYENCRVDIAQQLIGAGC